MSGKATSTGTRQSDADPEHTIDPPREDLHSQRQEVLRLRDLLIARDAELGAARGRLAELEAHSMQVINLVARIRALVPGFVWRARASLRRQRS